MAIQECNNSAQWEEAPSLSWGIRFFLGLHARTISKETLIVLIASFVYRNRLLCMFAALLPLTVSPTMGWWMTLLAIGWALFLMFITKRPLPGRKHFIIYHSYARGAQAALHVNTPESRQQFGRDLGPAIVCCAQILARHRVSSFVMDSPLLGNDVKRARRAQKLTTLLKSTSEPWVARDLGSAPSMLWTAIWFLRYEAWFRLQHSGAPSFTWGMFAKDECGRVLWGKIGFELQERTR